MSVDLRVSKMPDFFPSVSFLSYLDSVSGDYLDILSNFDFESRKKSNSFFDSKKMREIGEVTVSALKNYLSGELCEDFDKLFLFRRSVIDSFSVFLNEQFNIKNKVDSWELESTFKGRNLTTPLRDSGDVSVYKLDELEPYVKNYFMRLGFRYNNVFFSKASVSSLNSRLDMIITSNNPQDRLSFLRVVPGFDVSSVSYPIVKSSSSRGVTSLKREKSSNYTRENPDSVVVRSGSVSSSHKDIVGFEEPSDDSVSSYPSSGVAAITRNSLGILSEDEKKEHIHKSRDFYSKHSYLFINSESSASLKPEDVIGFLKKNYSLDSSFEFFLQSSKGKIFLNEGVPLSEKKVYRIYDVRDAIIKHFNH